MKFVGVLMVLVAFAGMIAAIISGMDKNMPVVRAIKIGLLIATGIGLFLWLSIFGLMLALGEIR